MAIRDKLVSIGLCACLTLPAMIGCEEKGPAERAGEKIDKAVKDSADAMEEAGKKLKEQMD
ncbi:MAG: hypothetical protein JSU59_02315 [Nitrospirota bacterium]|nr:MAG: hypothetical protein JSU59_02315 [Nitrospirota bacterium]